MNVRKIIHVDMDAFYASVEQRDNPGLRGKAVIVGGKPGGRGVVAACSYEARAFGVHSAMPSAEAGRRCPHAVFLKPRFEAYQAVSRQIQSVFREFTSLVEPLSLDEAYLDVTDNTLFGGSALLLAREIKSLILERTDLVASAGVSYNKFLAKVASDHDKPDGLFCIRPEEGAAFVDQLAIGKFHGIGKVTESRMHALNIFNGADLKRWNLEELQSHFGKNAQYYYSAARGVDDRPVRESRTRKSIGSERTFSSNIENPEQMLQILQQLCGELLEDLLERRLAAATLSIKVRFGDFETLTRAHSLGSGFFDNAIALRTLPHLLDKALKVRCTDGRNDERGPGYTGTNGVRLLGVTFSALQPVDVLALRQLEFDLGDDVDRLSQSGLRSSALRRER